MCPHLGSSPLHVVQLRNNKWGNNIKSAISVYKTSQDKLWEKVLDPVGRTHIKLLIVVELGAREGRVAQRGTERVEAQGGCQGFGGAGPLGAVGSAGHGGTRIGPAPLPSLHAVLGSWLLVCT